MIAGVTELLKLVFEQQGTVDSTRDISQSLEQARIDSLYCWNAHVAASEDRSSRCAPQHRGCIPFPCSARRRAA